MILGHERQIEYFDKLLKSGRLGHAYFFYGPEHVGKFTVAQSVAKKLPCLYPIILDLEHTLVSKKETRKDIPIEDIRELKRILSLASQEKEYRAVIINDAHALNEEASGALLKLLEEPGERTVFFLVAPEKDLLPATIVSRTVPIRFSSIPQQIMAGYLAEKHHDKSLAEDILALSFGRPGLMIRYITESGLLVSEQKFRLALRSALKAGGSEIFRFSQKASQDENLRKSAGMYVFYDLRSALVASPQSNSLPGKIKKIHEIYQIANSTNVNHRLALDVLLLEAKNIC